MSDVVIPDFEVVTLSISGDVVKNAVTFLVWYDNIVSIIHVFFWPMEYHIYQYSRELRFARHPLGIPSYPFNSYPENLILYYNFFHPSVCLCRSKWNHILPTSRKPCGAKGFWKVGFLKNPLKNLLLLHKKRDLEVSFLKWDL